MNRVTSGLKKLIELYLVIVGGGYALAFLVGLIGNGMDLLHSSDATEAARSRGDVQNDAIAFFVALVFLIAGIGIHKFRLWGLALAITMAVLAIGYSVSQRRLFGVWDYHDFVITLPMTLISIWAISPPTWSKFQKQRIGAT